MKTIPGKLHHSLFSQDGGGHTARLIKADQLGKLTPAGHGHGEATPAAPRKDPEIRLVGTGPDYCDLEIVCGCGDTTRFRCWNTPSPEEKGAK